MEARVSMPRAMPKSTRPLVNWSMRAMSSATRKGVPVWQDNAALSEPESVAEAGQFCAQEDRVGSGVVPAIPGEVVFGHPEGGEAGLVGEFDLGLGFVDYLFPRVCLAYVSVEGDVKAHLRSQGLGIVSGFDWLLCLGRSVALGLGGVNGGGVGGALTWAPPGSYFHGAQYERPSRDRLLVRVKGSNGGCR